MYRLGIHFLILPCPARTQVQPPYQVRGGSSGCVATGPISIALTGPSRAGAVPERNPPSCRQRGIQRKRGNDGLPLIRKRGLDPAVSHAPSRAARMHDALGDALVPAILIASVLIDRLRFS